jgi:peptidoglycan/LPS O-acetylase OafA/YrhL
MKQQSEINNTRFAYIDNLRTFAILMVITLHTAVTYSGLAEWYYKEASPEDLSFIEAAVFGFLVPAAYLWTMCMLFFISAFFAVRSLKKYGTIGFIKNKSFRLGVPSLIYMFIIYPFILCILLRHDNAITWSYIRDWYSNFLISPELLQWSNGPLWFCEILLIFCIVYAIIRHFFVKRKADDKKFQTKNIALIILLVGIVSFLVRIELPTKYHFLGFRIPYFPSFIAMFILGIIVGENNLFDKISDKKNIKWLKASLIIGIPIWAIIMLASGADAEIGTYFSESWLKGIMRLFSGVNTISSAHLGGCNWLSFVFALWESFFAIGFSIGIIALFRKNLDINNKFTQLLADNSFSLYVFHAPVQVAIVLSLKSIVLMPWLKFLIVLAIVQTACLIFCILIRKIKIIRILFK